MPEPTRSGRRSRGPAAPQVVVGGTVAALVAADAIAAEGRDVTLLLPERGVGGGFAALEHEGRTLELGVRLLELDFEGTAADTVPDLSAYAPEIGGHRAFAPLISAWTHALLGDRLREIAPPAMVLDGRRAADLLFTVDLSALGGDLAPAERTRMLAEARAARAALGEDGGVLAPAHAPRLAAMSLAQASLANHGPTFHARFIAPLCDKVLAGGADGVLATLRRKVWAPLFHPRTLAQALAGEPLDFRPRRPFHSVAPEGCGAVVGALLARLRSRPTATLRSAGDLTGVRAGGDGTVTLHLSGHAPVTARRPVLAVSAETLFGAAGIPYAVGRVQTVIAWLEVAAADGAGVPELVHVLDPDNPVLRVSRGGRAAGDDRALLTVELRHDVDRADAAARAAAGLVAAGLLPEAAPVTTILTAARPTFPIPDAATLRAFAAARERFDALGLDVELAGGALHVTADTLNDQILQGLRARERTA